MSFYHGYTSLHSLKVSTEGGNSTIRMRATDSIMEDVLPGGSLRFHALAAHGRIQSMLEHALYPPVKAFLETQGYVVKGEVNGCDLVATRGEEPPVIVELKTTFSLPLIFQGIARQGLSDNVYLAVPPFSRPYDPPD